MKSIFLPFIKRYLLLSSVFGNMEKLSWVSTFIMNMEKLSWVSTVVGSFPYENTPENMEAAFLDQINAGVDYPCYPQLIDMVSQFLDPLVELKCGLEKMGEEYLLKGALMKPDRPIALEYGKFVLDFFEKYPELKSKVKGWKACLTGPFTLAGKIIVDEDVVGGKKPIIFQEPRAIQSKDLLLKLAEIMADVAKEYNKMGATIISMDDPTLGLIVGRRKIFYHRAEDIIEILNKAIEPIEGYSSIHICGRISPKLRDIMLESNVNILDHEFQKSDNDDVFEKSMFEGKNKILAYGILQSSLDYHKDGKIDNYVESEEKLKSLLDEVSEKYGKNNIILKPDCGFGGLLAQLGNELGSEVVRQKLALLNKILH